ncbi:MAG: twin-arginine translocase TatA/TatE family subunit [Calditrichaeota bacterium]|nr:MAG: twin-arginine translocase TatA/TatE family subunit [Calditrichota bacterium]
MFPSIGMSELLFIMLLVLLVFGPNKMPELARGIGKALNELRRATDDVKRELDVAELDEPSNKQKDYPSD